MRWLIIAVVAGAITSCNGVYRPPADGTLAGVFGSELATDRELGRVFGACSPPDADMRREIDRFRQSLRSWFEVIRHIEECDLGRVRHYTRPWTADQFVTILQRISYGSPQCHADVEFELNRFQSAMGIAREWTALGSAACANEFYEREGEALIGHTRRDISTASCRIANYYGLRSQCLN